MEKQKNGREIAVSAKSSTRDEELLTIVVAAATRNRPAMVSKMLESWLKLIQPKGTNIVYLVVENDTEPRCLNLVNSYSVKFSGRIHYVMEPTPGIPFARNKAAKFAIEHGAGLLAFIDDDEIAKNDWLDKLVDAYRSSDANLLGGPVLAAGPPQGLSFIGTLIYSGAVDRYQRKAQKAAQSALRGGNQSAKIVTGNWMSELETFTKHNVWFDQKLQFTGGSDSKFCWDVMSKGLKTLWVSEAIAYESIPKERLTFAYQYRRGRDQSNNHFTHKIKRQKFSRLTVILTVPLRILILIALCASLPFNRGKRLLDVARGLGWISGRFGALLGQKSELYRDTTGS